jgi:hypothetical protein
VALLHLNNQFSLGEKVIMKLAQFVLPFGRSRLVRSGKGLKPIENMKTFKALFGIVTITAALALQIHAQSFLTNGLVAYYPFNGNANDAVGTNNGTVYGATLTTDRFGIPNSAYSFNGTSAYIETVNPLPDMQSASASCWISVAAYPANGSYVFMDGDTDGGHDFVVGLGGNTNIGNIAFATKDNIEIWGNLSQPLTNTWFHVVAVADNNNNTNVLKLWLNGQLVATSPSLGNANVGYHSQLYIGCRAIYDDSFFNGAIDDVRLYNRALSDSEVQQLYAYESAPSCVSPPAGLVSWWLGQGNANDIAGANNGTLLNGATFAPGKVGQAFSFDGLNDVVQIPSSPSLSFASNAPMTVELWAYRTGSAGTMHLIGKRNGCGAGGPPEVNYQMALNMPLGQGLSFGPGNGILAASGLDMPMNTWTHLVGTFDGSNLRLYVNGSLVATHAGTLGFQNADPLLIGGSGDCPKFAGLIDEVSIYDRALTASEIVSIYTAGGAGKCRLTPSPRTATATATVANDFVVGATITDGGYGYTNTPIAKIIGGGGSGAQAVAVVSNGVVVAVHFLDAGSGYTTAPLIVIDPPFIPNPVLDIAPMSFLVFSNLTLGGVYQLQQWVGWYWSNQPVSFTATNALYTQMVAGVADSGDYRLALNPVPAQAFATAQVVNGFVVGATVTSGGSGYVTGPAVTIVGGGGTNATAVSHISGGVVTSISIFDAGNGYTNAPTVRIAPPPAAAVSPTVLPVMRVDSANLAPYDDYQVQFKPDLGGAWGNWNGGLFSPTDVTNSQYLFITNGVGFFRLQYVP